MFSIFISRIYKIDTIFTGDTIFITKKLIRVTIRKKLHTFVPIRTTPATSLSGRHIVVVQPVGHTTKAWAANALKKRCTFLGHRLRDHNQCQCHMTWYKLEKSIIVWFHLTHWRLLKMEFTERLRIYFTRSMYEGWKVILFVSIPSLS